MHQKAPEVPTSNKVPPSTSKIRGLSSSFKTEKSKALPSAASPNLSSKNTKIGCAETKPVTRKFREKTVQSTTKFRGRSGDRAFHTRTDTSLKNPPSKPTSIEPGRTRTLEVEKKYDKTSDVPKILKRGPPPLKPDIKTHEPIFPLTNLTTQIPKTQKKAKLKQADVRNQKTVTVLSVTGPSQGKQEAPLKGAPSVSSLDSKHHKVAPAREKSIKIFSSREKLNKPNKKKDLGNNNAVIEDPEFKEGLECLEDGHIKAHEYGSSEELGAGAVDAHDSQECVSLPVTLNAEHMPGFQEVELAARVPSEASIASGLLELETLRRNLEVVAMERAQMQARVDELLERAHEADRLRAELEPLKNQEAERNSALERLADENGALRARLKGVAHSPLSDNEKRQLLLAPTPRRMHSSAPASIALAHNGEGDGAETSNLDWDKHTHTSSSISEVSVACLQDRILQMEEHHYSTKEELQATLAELTDLQSQLAEAHVDNERLSDEKQFLFESLCRQTEKLEDSRNKVDTLQEMLKRDGADQENSVSGDQDQKLLTVLKVSQEERRILMSQKEQLEAELAETKAALEEKIKENETLTELIRTLEASTERSECERVRWENEASAAMEAVTTSHQQVNTLSELLSAAQAQLTGAAEGAAAAESAATAAARRDADAAASRAHTLAERLVHAQRQLDRALSDARKLHDDALVSSNNAKATISELKFQLEQARQEKNALQAEYRTLQDNIKDLHLQLQVSSDEKLSLISRAGEARSRAADLERQLAETRARLATVTRDRDRDEIEWNQFQNDLLMTVRVANDFKTEAQREMERLVSENKVARDLIRSLEDQIHSLKVLPPRSEDSPQPPPLLSSASLQDIMATAASHRRTKGGSREDPRLSVKSLIESIENAAKAAKQAPAADWPQVQTTACATTTTNTMKNGISESSSIINFAKPPASRTNRSSPNATEAAGSGDNLVSIANMPDEQRTLASLQQKAMESFVRRNSYGDICERKDPLTALQVKNGGSKRNALLKWCQQKTMGYNNIDITNFSSSWNDGLALCALLHSYLEDTVPYSSLTPQDKRTNFSVAFAAAESVGIPTTLNIQDMIHQERPDWQQVMAYVTSIYKHFET